MSSYDYYVKPRKVNAKYSLREYAKDQQLEDPLYKCGAAFAADASSIDEAVLATTAVARKGEVFPAVVEVGDRTFSDGKWYVTTKKAEIAAATYALAQIAAGHAPKQRRQRRPQSTLSKQVSWYERLLNKLSSKRTNIPVVVFAATCLCYIQTVSTVFEYTDHGTVSTSSSLGLLSSDINGLEWSSAERGCSSGPDAESGSNWWRPLGVLLYSFLASGPEIGRQVAGIVLHAACASLVSSLCARLLLQHNTDVLRSQSTGLLTNHGILSVVATLSAGLIFGFHPMHATTLHFAESQQELLAAALALFATDCAVAELSLLNETPRGWPQLSKVFTAALACVYAAPFAGAAGVTAAVVLIFLSIRLKFVVPMSAAAHELGAACLYAGVMAIATYFGVRAILLGWIAEDDGTKRYAT